MVDKKEEYSFSLNPAEDSNPSIFLVGQPPESEAKEPFQKPSFVREKPQPVKEETEEKIPIVFEKPIKKEIKEVKHYEEPKKFSTEVSKSRKIRVIFTASLLTGLLLFMFLFASPSMTLNVGNKNIVPLSTLEERVDYNVSGNKSFILDMDYSKFGKDKNYASLGITGSVIGNGRAKVYLMDKEGKEYLLYDDEIKKSEKFFRLTGTTAETSIKTDKEKEDISPSILNFEYSCVDTCYPMLKEGKYILKVETDENTAVQINKLIFAV